ncbi:unnamed protein product [Gongylonema pulchrum]|uniref:WH2 domain-containing protein n=1 Tax=Gongylonema pulchrum TaxID=637853 RepID=A0A183D6U8_9BILA|nr:unnamed protein product [Gongylonema pulchrum]
MPVPPPPAPPPPPASSLLTPRTAAPVMMASKSRNNNNNNREKLLHEIQAGLKLRKTVTNDRSAPVLGGKVVGSSESNGGSASAGGAKQLATGGVGDLFVNGIPKKPSDNKRMQANTFKGLLLLDLPSTKTSPPPLPKPLISEKRTAKQITHSESLNQVKIFALSVLLMQVFLKFLKAQFYK